ncbi:hypothetical protein ACFOGI_04580 [Virgibacillus xinjiangensis]|uniref:Uncharacterized protein n=1 Tax=Virgibacillus xinjiangensis TaxID=393090 RepID=A0ABV7CSU8_9BACI
MIKAGIYIAAGSDRTHEGVVIMDAGVIVIFLAVISGVIGAWYTLNAKKKG